MSFSRLLQIQSRIAPLRAALLEHPLYEHLHNVQALRLFMQHHVFAVWDFMSLLKALQRQLSCTLVPWIPPVDGSGCRMVNEIVLAEESDADGQGGYCSHFELYRRAMQSCGAETGRIDQFVAAVGAGSTISAAFETAGVETSVRQFVQHTFATIESNGLGAIAAAFTFGREDLLPHVFQKIVDALNAETGGMLEAFKFYLDRHIELDGGEHGPMATRLVETLCGNDEARWQAAETAAVQALEARIRLWDGITRLMVARTDNTIASHRS